MVLSCPRCGKDDFKKTLIPIPELIPVVTSEVIPSSVFTFEPKADSKKIQEITDEMIQEIRPPTALELEAEVLAKVVSNHGSEVILQTDQKREPKVKTVTASEEDSEAGPGPTTQAHREGRSEIQFVKKSHDPACPHKSLKHLTVWKANHPSKENDISYLPSTIANICPQITEILERELDAREQIKSAITSLVTYRNKSDKQTQVYHRDNIRILLSKDEIDDQITKSVEKILVAISDFKVNESDSLANKKCTINPDNKDLIDLFTGLLSEKCLQSALSIYFAHQDEHIQNLERIFWTEKFKPYLERVKLNGIPIPTPVCSRVFAKIEEMNPDISINVWEWKKKAGIPKPVVASKNYNCPYIIHLMALTDITKSNKGKEILNPSPGRLDEAPQRVKLPVKGINDFEQFKNFNRIMYYSCVIIADFEADNKRCDENYGGNMYKIIEQKANSFCYIVY
ncbi:hypothetical protein C1646_776136 [Rhizophagus diaphanus]|nr:hypothetical protein C1646_776136 [Rhizophagus diaphanus] [Rhizophagus sp. MUCL 43196]